MRHGGQILISQLEAEGVSTVYCVPDAAFLGALDGLYDSTSIQTVVCRHHAGATLMAASHARLTGTPGICFAGQLSGLAASAVGLVAARRDCQPLILFAALPEDALPSLTAYAAPAKWAAAIPETRAIADYVNRAMALAVSDQPGPVILGITRKLLCARANIDIRAPAAKPKAHPGESDMAALSDALRKSSRPLMAIGGPHWSETAARNVGDFAYRFDLPVISTKGAHDYLDNRHPSYAGAVGGDVSPPLAERIMASDLIFCLGTAPGDISAQDTPLLTQADKHKFLIHVSANANGEDAAWRANLPIHASPSLFTDYLDRLDPPGHVSWHEHRKNARADYEMDIEPQMTPGAVKLERVIESLSNMLEPDAILTHGTGNYAGWIERYFQSKRYGTYLATKAGVMGYALPAAIAAKLQNPARQVVAITGDGSFMTTAPELATAIHYGLAIIVIVVNNRIYGATRMHQERDYPGRILGTSLTNPDFAHFAKSFGAFGAVVERTRDFRETFKKAEASGLPAVIELRTDKEAISPRHTLRQIANMEPVQ